MAASPDPSSAPPRRLPLVQGDPERLLVVSDGRQERVRDFIAHVHGVAAQLPDSRAVVNLCEDRYRFLVGLCAAALRGQTTLLPPARAPEAVAHALAVHGPGYVLAEAAQADHPDTWPLPARLPEAAGEVPRVPADAPLVKGFTSGSTGVPQVHVRTLGMFRRSTAQNHAALRDLWPDHADAQAVATVPSQHMYGMELAVMWPLLADVAIHAGRPLFPEEVGAALHALNAPRLLITTPVHLKALMQVPMAWPPLAGIVCSTAPLAPELALAAEAAFGCEVRELFGSTETLITASRRTAVDTAWTPLAGIRFDAHADHSVVHASHLPAPVAIADVLALQADGRFRLQGRQADLIDIAGKRASLGDITARLLRIPGVQDAVAIQLPARDGSVPRVAAAVVAPGVDATVIMNALRAQLDAVFLPRPLKQVDALPRNASGKLPREQVLRLLES